MTRNKFSRSAVLATSAGALLLVTWLSPARAQQDGVDHSKMDHGAHAPAQWVDPVTAQSGGAAAKPDAGKPEAAKPDATKSDEHAGHHGGAGGGGMMGGGMMGGMSGMSQGGGGAHAGHGGGGMMKHMMCGFTEHLEGRLAYLKAELKLTDSQSGAWNAFADGWRAAAQKAAQKCETTDDRPDPAKPPVLHKLSKMESHMVDHLEIVRAQKAAIEPLFTALSDEQKKIASETFTTIMKVGMSMGSMMSGGGMMGGMGAMMGGGMSHGGSDGGSGGMKH